MADGVADRPAGRTAAREARRRQQAFVLANWPRLITVPAGCVALTLAVLVWSDREAWAFLLGVLDATVVWLLVLWVIEASGSTSWRMGALGEGRTGEELARLGAPWFAIHGVVTDKGDVDHVVIGPAGVFALETKWSSERWSRRTTRDRERLGAAAAQAKRSARAVRSRLYAHTSRWFEVTPVVVLWGASDLGDGEVVDTVAVVRGATLRQWLAARDPDVLAPGAVAAAAAGLDAYVQKTEPASGGDSRFVTDGVEAVALELVAAVAGALAGLLLAAFALAAEPVPVIARFVGVGAAALAGVWVRRRGRGPLRLFGFGLACAAAATLVVVLLVVAIALVVR